MRAAARALRASRSVRVLRVATPPALLALLVWRLGAHPFERGVQVLTPLPVLGALLLGAVTTVAQALRWRTVAIGYGSGAGLTRTRAVGECYRSALLNSVLPGGVLGDALRAWRQRPAGPTHARALGVGARVIVVERVIGTTLLLASVAVVVFRIDPRLSGLLLLAALVAGAVTLPGLRRLPAAGRLAVVGWSALALAALVAKFVLAAAVLGTGDDVGQVITLALIALLAMSVPVGVGGFGPREAVAVLMSGAIGLSASDSVSTTTAYGLLAAVSALPGALVMLLEQRRTLQPGVPRAGVPRAASIVIDLTALEAHRAARPVPAPSSITG